MGVMPRRDKGPAAAAGSVRRHVSEERSACSSPLTIATFEGVLETHSSERGTTSGARRVGGCHGSAERTQSEGKERCGGAGPPPKQGRVCDAEGAETHAHCPAYASGNGAAGTRSNPRFSIFDQEDCITPLLPLVRASERKNESDSGLGQGVGGARGAIAPAPPRALFACTAMRLAACAGRRVHSACRERPPQAS